jgi:hypothetical protein
MLRGSSDMTGRRAPLAACLALAAELAEEWDILPFAAPEVTAWSGMFASNEQRDNRPEMALDLVRQYLAAHADKMWGSNDGSRPPASGWIGHEAKEGPALLPEKLREELRKRGYELDAVIPGWLETGALLTRDSQRPPYLIGRRTAGCLSRHLIFRDEVIDPGPGGRPVRNLCVMARYKVSLSGNCVTAGKRPLTCGKPVTSHCVTRNSRGLIATLRVALRNRSAYQLFAALTCMFPDHLRDCYAVTQNRESHARAAYNKTETAQ